MSLIAPSIEAMENTRRTQPRLQEDFMLLFLSADRRTVDNKTKYIAVSEEQRWNWSELD